MEDVRKFSYGIFAIVLIIGIGLVFILGGGMASKEPASEPAEKRIAFKTLDRGSWRESPERKNYVIRDIADWALFWSEMGYEGTPTVIDFADYVVLAAFMGEQPTGGYSLQIVKIMETDDTLEVFVKETSPGNGCAAGGSASRPYQVVRAKRVDKSAVFYSAQETKDCK